MPSVSRKVIYILVCLSFLLTFTGVQPAYAAGITVTTTADENNTGASCSLREAITAANTNAAVSGCSAGSGTDTITLPAGTYTLSSELPAVTSTIIINGNGAASTIIQANANPNTSGYRIISVNSGGNLTLNSLTARNGYITSISGKGGGIYNSGTLTITNSAISGNNASNGSGGGVYNDSSTTLVITNSTFSANSAGNNGGGVNNLGTLTITNSTFSANSSGGGGVGGGVNNGGTLTIRNSTFSGNSAIISGGGISNSGTLNYANTIIANSTSGGDCTGAGIGTNTNNLVENGGCSAALSGDPNLGPLADNGGPTQTMALIYPSPALNAGDDATCAAAPVNNLDQRGLARPQGTHCDIGAYEVTPTQSGPALIVNSTADTSDDVCDLASQGFGNQDCTLREAIATSNAQAGANTITFAGNYTITLTSALPIVTTQVTITGNGTANTIVQGGASAGVGQKHVFQVSSTGNLTLDQVTVQYGSCTGTCSGGNGGGVLNQGTLTVTNSLFDRNNATTFGGSIANSGTLNVSNTTFTSPGISTSYGGAIANLLSGTATISNSTFSQNTAGDGGGGLYSSSGSVTISHSSFTDNSSYNAGGAINNDVNSTMTITNSTITNNTSTNNVTGGVINSGTLSVYNSTLSGNTSNSGVFDGANLTQYAGVLNLYNSIIANSGGTDGDCGYVAGTINANNNLMESTGALACNLTNGVNGNIIGSDPALGSLTGSPAYFPLNTGSLAIDAGSNAICAAAPVNNQSQNGATRPFGTHCDIGSFEANPTPLPTGWVGSVSVTSDKNLVSVGRPHIGSEVASYDGFSSGSTTAFVPMLFKDAFGGDYDAALYIQNVSGSSASVTIQYYDSSGVLNCTKADTIAPLASKGYWLPAATCDTGSLPTGWVGGVKVTSNHPIVAVGRPHIGSEVMTYNGFSSGSTSAFIPMLFKGAFGGSYNAAFYVQNVSGSSANVTLEYFDNTGTLNCTKSDTIASLASKGYWLPAATCDTGSLPAGWVGGVRVSSSQPVVTVGRPHIDTQITTYDGFSAGANSAFVPMLFKGAFGGSYNAAFYLQNVSNSSASVTIKYYDNAGTLNCTKADTIAPLASKGYWVPAATCDTGSLPAGWVGGVEVTSDQPIVSVGRPHIDAQVTTYNGFTAGATDVFLPMLFKDAFGGSYDSAFYLQNTEATAASVTIQFYDSTGALTCSRVDTIQPRATLGFWVPSATCFP